MKKIIGIDLFSGAGGLSLGAEMAGVEVKYAVEIDKYAAETYKTNHPQTVVFNKDIREIDDFEIEPNTVSIMFGGAPCQGYSTSNRRTNNRENPDNWLYKEFIRLLNKIKPDWVVFENVTGLLEMESGGFFQNILSDFFSAGYECSYSILNASDYGVPQRRSRLFLVGSKEGKRINLSIDTAPHIVTVKEALSDLPALYNGADIDILPYPQAPQSIYAQYMRGNLSQCSGHLVSKNAPYILERYKHVKQGQNWSSIPKNLMENYTDSSRCHTGIYYRLREDQPSVVIGNYRKNMLIHPFYDRGLSVREAARLQSFPDYYVFKGSIGYQQQQVGNAVPPLLARYVFERILKLIH